MKFTFFLNENIEVQEEKGGRGNLLEFEKEHFAFIILFNPQNNPETGATIFT